MFGTALRQPVALIVVAMTITVGGCTTPGDYLRNWFKVGPDYGVPEGDTADQWIDEADVRVRSDYAEVGQWWAVFQDPTLDRLVTEASSQNLTLREAGFRVLEARAQLGIATGNLFPQQQNATGGFQRLAVTKDWNYEPNVYKQFFDQWGFGFNLSWELDLWGRLRRAIAADEYTLEASSANYEDVLVTLLGDVADNYVQVRTLQQRIEYARTNVDLQSRVLKIAERRFKAGRTNELDAHQARSNLAQTESKIPQLQVDMRQACNRLCVLLGIPPTALEEELGPGPIPTAPTSVAIGIPAELLRRRPDVRRAEYEAAAQGEKIGIAEADLYPMFGIGGTLGWQSTNMPTLFTSGALNSNVGPWFQWNLLNYGRIRNNMRVQDAKFWQLVTKYQNMVLRANAEVEDGLVAFLRAQQRAELLDTSVGSSQKAVDLVVKKYEVGTSDFNRVTLIQQNLVEQQDLQAKSYGEIAQGLIQVYRALGGGWQVDAIPAQAGAITPIPVIPIPDESVPEPPVDEAKAPYPPGELVKTTQPATPRRATPDSVKPSKASPATTPKVRVVKTPSRPAARAPSSNVAAAPLPPAPAAPPADATLAPFPPAPATSGAATVFTAGLERFER